MFYQFGRGDWPFARRHSRRKLFQQRRRGFPTNFAVRLGTVDVGTSAVRHAPVEIVFDSPGEVNGVVAGQQKRLKQVENVALVFQPLGLQVAQIELASVEDDGVALIQQSPIARHPAIGDFATGLDERLLAHPENYVRSIVISRPVQNSFRFSICFNILFIKCNSNQIIE